MVGGIKTQTQRVNKYYQDYEQGVNTTLANGINVKLPSDGMKETITQNPAYVDKVVNLSKNLRNAEVVSTAPPIHNHKYPIKQFHRLKGDNADYYVAENQKGNYYFHKVATPNLTGPKPEGQGLPKPFDYKKINQRDSLGIIPQSTQNLNPNLENISKKPSSFNEWLEELKRKRKFKGW